MFSVTVTPWRVEESAPHPVVIIVVGPPSGWELQAGESRLAGHNAICPLVRYLIILVSVKLGQARMPTCGGVWPKSMPRAVGTGAVSTHPHSIAFPGQAGEGLGVAQGGWIWREGGIARASVTVPWRASAVTPAGRARGRLAAPTPRARPASAPRLSSPPWYGRRSRRGAVPTRPLSHGRCPPGLGVCVSL